jgi:hypothetical protein
MIIKHKPIEKKNVPQMRDLKEGETFQLLSDPNKVYVLTEYMGDDLAALFRYRNGDEEEADNLIESSPVNNGKDRCTGSYRVAVNVATGQFALFHNSIEVIPVNCELYFQEKENYNI